ncbi:DUF3991 and TOPRIM domain-containing protein [Roseburia hominis]
MNKKWKTPEEKQELYRRIKEEIRIEDYAREIGLSPYQSAGSRHIKLREHDSVRIDADKNCFWRNSVPGMGKSVGKGGSVIDFALEFTSKSLAEVLSEFEQKLEERGYSLEQKPMYGYAKKRKEAPATKERLEGLRLPEAAGHMRNVFAYLTRSRFISKDVVQEFVDKKMLYQDVRNNCVFVAYDYTKEGQEREPVFGCIRGTNTERKFVRDVDGSDYEKGFFIDNQSDSVVITESVIEAMSIMSVMADQGLDYHTYSYLALSGTGKGMPIKTITENCPEFSRYIFALNHDEPGLNAMKVYAKYLREELKVAGELKQWIPNTPGFDWNDELKQRFFQKFAPRTTADIAAKTASKAPRRITTAPTGAAKQKIIEKQTRMQKDELERENGVQYGREALELEM